MPADVADGAAPTAAAEPPIRAAARNDRDRPRGAIDANRVDLYLQPIVTLPQRKVRYYEAMSRLRTEDGDVLLPPISSTRPKPAA